MNTHTIQTDTTENNTAFATLSLRGKDRDNEQTAALRAF